MKPEAWRGANGRSRSQVAFFDFSKRKQQAPRSSIFANGDARGGHAEHANELIHDNAPVPTDHDGPDHRGHNRRNARPGTQVLFIDDSRVIVALL